MILPYLVAGAKVVGAFLASQTLAATAVKFVIGVALLKHFSKPPPTPDDNRERNKSNVRAAVSTGRYIYGEARTGGVLAYILADGRDLWVVYALSRGACDSLTGLYIDGERQAIRRTAAGVVTVAEGKYAGKVTIWEVFAADGATSGPGPRALRSVPGSAWTTDHAGPGLSYVIAKLTQPEDPNAGVFSGFPELSFVVKGRKFAWPGQSNPAWTENAAAVIYDYLRVRRGVPADEIDGASFQAAYAICEEQVAVARPDSRYKDFPATERRYAANGIIFADDDPERIQSEFEFAIRGNVFEWNGKFRITAGSNRTPTVTITDADIEEVESITTAPPISDRVNVATMGLDQSRFHDFGNYSAPEVVDQAQLARDGERLEKNLGDRVLVNSPSALDRLLAGSFRRARSSMSVTIRLSPGRLLKWLALRPTELCEITNRVHGLDRWRGEVSAVTLNEDLSVTAVFDEIADGEFDDDLGQGAIPGRAIAAPRANDPPEAIPASGITATAQARAGGSGGMPWKVTVTVPASSLGFSATVSVDGLTLTDFTPGNSLQFDVSAFREDMTVTVWRESRRGLAGPTTTVTVSPGYSELSIPLPSLARRWEQTGNDLLVTVRDPGTPIVKGAEFRYTFESLTNADGTENTAVPGTLTAAGWTAASILDAQTLLFKPNTDGLFNLKFRTNGKYRIHARFVDAHGRYGAVADLGYITMIVPENPSHIIGGGPSWPGTLNHMHRFALGGDAPLLSIPAGSPATLSADEWDGKAGASFWPFGPVEGEDAAFDASSSTYYETSTLDLGLNKSGYFDVDFEVYTPGEPEGAGGASAASGASGGPGGIDAVPEYLPAFTGPALDNQTWQIGQPIEPVMTPAADVPHGFLTYTAEGLPDGVAFGGGRLTGIPGPVSDYGVARITATAENGAADHSYFAWQTLLEIGISPATGSAADPHSLQGWGAANIRDHLRDGAMNADDPDPGIPTWFAMMIPARSVYEFRVTAPPGDDFDLVHKGRTYARGGRLEVVRLTNPTASPTEEKVGVYRYAAETDASLINRNSEGGVSHPPVRASLAPLMPAGKALAEEGESLYDGAAGQAVTGEFVAEMAVFHAPSVNAGETPSFTEAAIAPGERVAVSSARFLKGRIHVKKARNRALKGVAFTFLES